MRLQEVEHRRAGEAAVEPNGFGNARRSRGSNRDNTPTVPSEATALPCRSSAAHRYCSDCSVKAQEGQQRQVSNTISARGPSTSGPHCSLVVRCRQRSCLNVLWLILREGTFLVVTGAVLAAPGRFAVARALSALDPLDPDHAHILGTLPTYVGDQVLLVGAPMLVVAAALLACAVPVWRAVRIDPASTLCAE